MSLYDLATTSGRTAAPVLIIKNSAGAAADDPQNIVVFSNSTTGTSVILSPNPPMYEADDTGQPNVGGAASPVVVNVQSPEVKSALTKIARFIPTETITIESRADTFADVANVIGFDSAVSLEIFSRNFFIAFYFFLSYYSVIFKYHLQKRTIAEGSK